MIYLSTGGFSELTFCEVSKLFDNKIVKGLELSSGKYSQTLQNDLLEVSKRFDIAMHNYFPVPKTPFVFNLASFDSEILEKSMEHARNAIALTAKFGGSVYSFHAGYLLDPDVNELGARIKSKKLNSRSEGLLHFIRNVNELSSFAKKFNISLLIENNVLSAANMESFGCNPLLMTDPTETKSIFDKVDSNVKLLIDVAHLKVSANTLKYDPVKFIKDFSAITKGYHISDNNGLEDSNEEFSRESWFVKHIRKDLSYYSIEVYEKDVCVLEKQYALLMDILR